MLVYVAGIRAFNDQQLVVPLLKQIYFVGVVCATFLVKQIYFNLTDVSVWIFDDAHLVACWISWADQIYVWTMWTFNTIQMFY